MNLNRRSFLRGAGGLVAAGVATPLLKEKFAWTWWWEYHVIYGDGVHDDTVAVNAWGKGKRVYDRSGNLIGSTLKNVELRLTDTVHIRADNRRLLNLTVKADPKFRAPVLIRVHEVNRVEIDGCCFIGNRT